MACRVPKTTPGSLTPPGVPPLRVFRSGSKRLRRGMTGFVARTSIALLCATVSVSVHERSARAEATLADKAAAQTLFDEGRKLMAAGKFVEACPKLAESQKLDPGVGTQFHLADCYERTDQTASAWAGFLDAASAARSMGQADREKVAKERAAALAPRLSKLTITSSAVSLDGLEIKRDGAAVGRALWGTAVPVDPGSHLVEATAPGKKPWRSTVKVEGDKASVVVTVPALDDAPVETQATPSLGASTDVPADGKSRRTLALVVGGVGVVGLGIGTVFALQAKAKYDDSLPSCPTDKNICSAQGVSLRDDARTAGNVATVAIGAGAAALVAGAILFLTAPSAGAERDRPLTRPSAEKPGAMLVPSAGPGMARLTVWGIY